MRMIKVCNVDEEGRFGGPERRIVQVAVALREYGVQTHVVYPALNSETFEKNLIDSGVLCTKMDITRLSTERKILVRYLFRFVFETLKLSRFFKANAFDVVHANGSYQFKTAIAAKIAGVPLVWHLNDTRMNAAVKSVFSALGNILSKGFIVAGERVFDYYLKDLDIKNKPCIEIHAPVDTEKFKPKIKTPRDSDRDIIISTVSGINPDKGVEYFVKLAAKVLRDYPSIKFRLAGAGLTSQKSYSQLIKKTIEECNIPDESLQFLGLIDDVPEFIDDSDICVFTSVSEAGPTSIWEALAMGKPVITTDVGSVKQYIEDGVSGYVVPVADVDALYARASELIKDKEKRSFLGRNARDIAVSKLDISAAAKLHSEIYEKVLT